MTESELLNQIKDSYQAILQQKLVGIYIHGSIAFRCFAWSKSDIDFIVVVNETPDLEEKVALISELLALDKYGPPKGFEMSVVLEGVCNQFQYPTPYELHFSNGHKDKCEANLQEYCRNMNGTDKDLAAHFTVIREVGYTLCGKRIPEVFGEVPKKDYIDSIKFDVEDAWKGISDNAVYYILNLCRVLAYMEDSLVISKKQGGEWGIRNLPQEYQIIIEKALVCYSGGGIMEAELEGLSAFAEYMLRRIYNM